MHYKEMLQFVFDTGVVKEQRAKTKDGKPLTTISRFAPPHVIQHDLSEGFPLTTLRPINFDIVKGELLWFLSGSTNIRDLKRLGGGNIWDAWATSSGDLGPIYGKQWRRWESLSGFCGDYPLVIDQIDRLQQMINICKNHPNSAYHRRLILTSWNPGNMPHDFVPTGCHTMAQFEVHGGKLSCQVYQRSADMFLGLPFNIASYALLTHLFAATCGLDVGLYSHVLGDAHIYENHVGQVKTILARDERPKPTLQLTIKESALKYLPADVAVNGYDPHEQIRGEVAV